MKNSDLFHEIENIFWDFDGVLIDSMPVRNKGFELVLKDYKDEEVQALLEFHTANGGLSRYVKFRYFFENIRNESITDLEINEWAKKFSEIMRRELTKPRLLINDSLQFVKKNYQKFNMYVTSGSDQNELRYLCAELELLDYFKGIYGSPKPKKDIVLNLIESKNYNPSNSVLIGDSINDFEAASANNIKFIGFNNPDLKKISPNYLESFYNV